MDESSRHRRIQELFHQALEQSESGRPAFLAGLAGDDRELASDVRSLLASDAKLESFEFEKTAPGWGAGAPATEGLQRGAALGRYLVLDELGRGGMGTVYAAYDPVLDRRVAIKLMRRVAGDASSQRLAREAQALARLAHPNIVAVHDVGEWEGQVFLAMELVAGRPLSRWLAEESPGWKRIVEVYLEAGRGLAAAHAAGLVHRDFKPDNAMLGDDGRVRVLDFGLARAADGLSAEAADPTEDERPSAPPASPLASPLTRFGTVVGTPAYMAPEQLAGSPPDRRTDQFAFAVALWSALYGEHPFRRGEAARSLPEANDFELVPPPTDSTVPDWVADRLARALALAPAERYATLDELLAALADDPRRRRRRIAAAAGVVLLAAAALWGIVLAVRSEVSACTGFERRLTGLWDAERRAGVESAFAATGAPFAADVFRVTALRLDAYAREWVDGNRDACEATRRGRQSAELLDRRVSCLEARREELGAFVELLERADQKLVERASPASFALSPLAACSDAEALLARVAPPADPAKREQVRELDTKIARIAAKRAAGRYKEALPEAEALVAPVAATGYRPLEASLAFALGDLRQRLGDPKAGEATLFDALNKASAGGDDALAASSASLLVAVVGRQLAQPESAERFARQAFAALERLGGDDRIEGDLHHFLGNVHGQAGDQARAAAEYEKALALRIRAFGADSPEVARTLNNLGTTWSERGDYARALEFYERSLRAKEAVLGPEHPDLSSNLNNIGIALWALGRNDEALARHQRALAIDERAYPPDHPSIALTLNNIGGLLNDAGRSEEALAVERRALAINEKALGPEHPELAYSLTSIGQALQALGRLREAESAFRRALAVAESGFGADHPQVGFALTGLGKALTADSRAAAAIPLLERALALRDESGGSRALVAETRFELARAERSAGGERGAALAAAQRALDELSASGARHPELADEIERYLAAGAPQAAARHGRAGG